MIGVENDRGKEIICGQVPIDDDNESSVVSPGTLFFGTQVFF